MESFHWVFGVLTIQTEIRSYNTPISFEPSGMQRSNICFYFCKYSKKLRNQHPEKSNT